MTPLNPAPRSGEELAHLIRLLAGGHYAFPLLHLLGRAFAADVVLDHEASVWMGDCTADALNATLPRAGDVPWRVYVLMKTDDSANALTILPAGSDTISGQSSLALGGQYDTTVIYSTGVEWIRLI